MDKPNIPKPSWPLGMHETVGNIETRTRKCLQDCLTGGPLLSAILLDVPKVTDIMRASAAESFMARATFYESQSGFAIEWLDEVVNETVTATLELVPVGFLLGSRYREAEPAIANEIKAELRRLLETRSTLSSDLSALGNDRPQRSDGASDYVSNSATGSKKRRGRPATISVEAKERGLEAKRRGATGKQLAQVVYSTSHPSPRQAKDVRNVLANYERSRQRTNNS